MTRPHFFMKMVLLAILVTAVLPARATAAPSHAQQAGQNATMALQWQTEVVDDSDDVGAFASLALDVEDRPHISYYDDASDSLKVAHYDGSTWQIQSLGIAAACQTSLILDQADRPHISYCGKNAFGSNRLSYAHYDGEEWQITPVSDEVASHTSLGLDSEGLPHISYHVPGALRYAHYDGSVWSFDTVDSDGDVGEYASLALDGYDQPHVSYYDATNGHLKYAHLSGEEWQVEPVDASGSAGRYTSLALNATGVPRISYYSGDHLWFAWHDGADWHSEPVDSDTNAGWFTSLALDSADQPRISYYQKIPFGPAPFGQLKYAHLEGSAWEIEVVDSGGDVGSYTALALDAAGHPHIAYHDTANRHLKHAEYDLEPPTITEGPVADPVTSDSADVHWWTNEESDSLVRYGKRAGVWDLQAQDSSLATGHHIGLTGLESSTTYHFAVQSADASGNTVTSREGFFTTEPGLDKERPRVSTPSLGASGGAFEYIKLSASASDNTGVERVEFYMDDKLVGTAYSAAPGGAHEFLLAPPHMGLPREEFYSQHQFNAVAYDNAGLSHQSSLSDIPLTPPLNGQLRILVPSPGHTLYAPGGTTPPGTTVELEVYASEYEWECSENPLLAPANPAPSATLQSAAYLPSNQMPLSMWPPWCHEVERAVLWVRFYMDGVYQATSTPDSSTDLVHDFTWDAGGLGPDTHEILVVAQLSDESVGQLERIIQIVPTSPSIDVNREIVRIDNHFLVRLLVENLGTATAEVERIVDNLAGFQAIRKTYDAIGETDDYYTVTTSYMTGTRRCDVTIGLHENTGGPLQLGPGESVIVGYLAVPILYANPWVGQYMAGDEVVQARYQYGTGWVNLELDRPSTHTFNYQPLAAAVNAARAASDYLIVSNPSRLFAENQLSPGTVNPLLSDMAELAQLKTGILGDATYSGPIIGPGAVALSYGRDYVKLLLDEWGRGMKGSDGILEHHSLNGYVLLVGESDIIPARDMSKGGWVVHLSDLWYGDTNNDWPNPERIVGRIIGNDAASLSIPIQTSIKVHRGELGFEFARDHALVIAGRGDGRWWFEQSADDVADKLDDEFDVVIALEQDEIEAGGAIMRDVFRQYAPGQDVFYYRDHASTSSWGDGATIVDTADLIGTNPIDLGNAKPFVFGCACLSGNYDGLSLAEAFLYDGAAIYIGATEVSNRWWNNKACKRFYNKWVNKPLSIGRALRDTKRDITEGDAWSLYEGDRWAAEYNLYGDPKYGSAPGSGAMASGANALSAEPPPTLSVVIPDYEVTSVEGMDSVEIPGGNTLFELGKPLVPIYTPETNIPDGYRVQDVTLTSRSGLVTDTGLNLPIAALEWDSTQVPAAAADAEAGWWPDEIFDWEARENVEGGSTLIIRLAPFYYNAATTDVKFYKNYEFDIQSESTSVAIELLATDRDAYPQGDEVLIDLWLNNMGEPHDVLVEAAIKSGTNDEVVAGLPLRTLKNVNGLATYSLQWDSTGHVPGSYYVDVKIRDTRGKVLDRDLAPFSLGICLGEITSFTANPSIIDPGDPVNISLDFENMGTVPISGTARIEVQDGAGRILEEFSHPVVDLAPTEWIRFEDIWDTTGVSGGWYRITGQVLYDAKATEPHGIDVRARTHIYLPCILRNSP